jgi:hypothetical protein
MFGNSVGNTAGNEQALQQFVTDLTTRVTTQVMQAFTANPSPSMKRSAGEMAGNPSVFPAHTTSSSSTNPPRPRRGRTTEEIQAFVRTLPFPTPGPHRSVTPVVCNVCGGSTVCWWANACPLHATAGNHPQAQQTPKRIPGSASTSLQHWAEYCQLTNSPAQPLRLGQLRDGRLLVRRHRSTAAGV